MHRLLFAGSAFDCGRVKPIWKVRAFEIERLLDQWIKESEYEFVRIREEFDLDLYE